ncbi:TorF family putative porin [Phenylobacterium sp. VNQ135]|uniref:TorF family putative porin n=1 Tax=Phenylobacterium sp. VNQ135 TaxID=3400922 RepID=UPI003C0F22D7
MRWDVAVALRQSIFSSACASSHLMKVLASLAALLGCACIAAPAFAADEGQPSTFEVELGAVSDYRFRGLSLSDEQPALQGGVTASLANGAYGYAWASTIAEYGAGADGKGATVEVDLVLGWAGSVAGFDVDASAQLYIYPAGRDVNYVELPISLSRATGAWRWTLGGAYAPAQEALGNQDNRYGWVAIAWQGAPVQVELRTGYEDGAYAPGGKWDWSAGVSRTLGSLAAGVAYVDSDERGSSAGIVASLKATF